MTTRLALSCDEVAQLLGVSVDSVYRAARKHEIPSLKVSGRVVIPRRWLEEALNTDAAAISDALTNCPPVDASLIGTADVASATEVGTTASPTHDQAARSAPGTDAVSTRTG